MASLWELVPQIAPMVPSAGEAVVKHAISTAARSFCRQTRAWEVELDPIDIVDGEQDYDLDAVVDDTDATVEIAAVTLAEQNDTTLTPPTDYYMATGGTLHLTTAPSADDSEALVVTVALLPAYMEDYIPDRLYTDYGDIIARGAQAALLLQPRKPYSDTKLGMLMEGEFRRDIGHVRYDLARGKNTTGNVHVVQRSC